MNDNQLCVESLNKVIENSHKTISDLRDEITELRINKIRSTNHIRKLLNLIDHGAPHAEKIRITLEASWFVVKEP